MNHLKKFSIFENTADQQKSEEDNFSLIDVRLYNQNNEKFFELADILQSKVFDDFDVIAGTNENWDDNDADDLRHKFWLFKTFTKAKKPAIGVVRKLISSKSVSVEFISSLIVYNIRVEEHEDLLKSLEDLGGLVEDYIGKKLVVTKDLIEHGGPFDLNKKATDVYDFTIKLENI